MKNWQMEIFENYDDGLKNAQLFKIYRDIFKSKDDAQKFNNICNKIKVDILNIIDESDLNTLERFKYLSDDAKKTFLTKIQKTKLFLEKSTNRYKFNDWLKQIIINSLYANETYKWIRYSRNANDFNKDEYYYKLLVHFNNDNKPKDTKMYYYTFLLIIDSLNLLEIIDTMIGFYDKEKKEGMESRFALSDYGRCLFSEIKEEAIFENLLDHDLIIKTERIAKEGKKNKFFTRIVKYTESVEIRSQKEFIKKVNKMYQESRLTVKVESETYNKVSFIDELYIYRKNNSVKLIELNCEIVDNLNIEQKDRKNNDLRYYTKLNSIEDKSISITDKRESISYGNISDTLSLLIQNHEIYNDFNGVNQRNDYTGKKGNDLLKINKMCFEINKKSMFRVYSRNSWSLHGRWYGGLQVNLPKIYRKNIYLNDSDEPLARLDFKSLHARLAYHLKGIPYYDDPYIINGYGKEYRDVFKIVALISFNAEDQRSAITAISDKLRKEELATVNYKEAKKLLIDFREQHHAIDSFITSDFGIKAMYYDSNIIAYCLSELMIKKGIFILTVHDEILCERKNIDEVEKQMKISYRKVLKKVLIERKLIGKEKPLPDDLQAIVDIE